MAIHTYLRSSPRPSRSAHQAPVDAVADMLVQVQRQQLLNFTNRDDVVPFLQEEARNALRQLPQQSSNAEASKPSPRQRHKSRSKRA